MSYSINFGDPEAFPQPPSDPTPEQWTRHIEQIEQRVSAAVAHPTETTSVLVGLALKALRAVPETVVTATRAQVLVAISDYNYACGAAMSGVEPAVEALYFARTLQDQRWISRALNALGIALGDTVDIAGAIEFYREGLDLAVEMNNPKAQSALWINLGTALINCAQHEDAIRCFRQSLRLCDAHAELSGRRPYAYGNIALACIQSGDVGEGLRSAQKAVELLADADDTSSLMTRAIAHTYYARLLLEVAHHEKAKVHSLLAKTCAERSGSPRATLSTGICEGLVECATGRGDIGLTRLMRLLDQARAWRTQYRDCLYALITAHQYMGDVSKAEPYVRELTLHERSLKRDYLGDTRRALLHEAMRPAFAQVITPEGETRLADENTPQWQRTVRMADAAVVRMDHTGEHGYRVGRLAALMAKEHGYSPAECRAIELAGWVHDIGMGSLPESVFGDRADAATLQRDRLRTHAELGAELLNEIDSDLGRFCKEVAQHHHERYDGTGYPMKLQGDQVPFAAQLIAVANAYDTLTHFGPKRSAKSPDAALDMIIAEKYKRFDPRAVELCVGVILKLKQEVYSISDYLAEAAQHSPLAKARKRIHNLLNSPAAPSTPPDH